MYVIWAASGDSPPYPNTQRALVSIGTPINPFAIPLEYAYIETGDLGPTSPIYFSGSWTPDGKFLYTWTSQDGKFHITRVDADGRNKETYPLVENQRLLADWSSDGAYIATTTVKQHNNLVNIWSASDFHLVASFIADGGAFNAKWSHSGNRLFYVTDSKVFPFIIASPDTQSAILIPYLENFDPYVSRITWSPDDKWILVEGGAGNPSFEYRADGTLQQVLTGYILDADFDQQKFVLQVYIDTKIINEWNVVFPETGVTKQIAKDVGNARPDPKNPHRYAIAWQRTIEELEVDLMDDDGQNRQTLFTTRTGQVYLGQVYLNKRYIDWSPDGSKILVYWDDGSQQKLGLFATDGTVLKEFANIADWQWLQNGQILAHVDYQNGQISVKTYDVTSGQERTIVEKMQSVILDDIDPQTDLFFGFYWQIFDGHTGVDVYDAASQLAYRVLTPDLPDFGEYSDVRPKSLYQSPDGQFIFASNIGMDPSFVYADNRIVSIPTINAAPYINAAPHIRWSHCNPYDNGDGKTP